MDSKRNLPVIPLEEFRKANTRDKCYVAMQNRVYDVTAFINEHPGGPAVFLQGGGKNVTEDFNTIGHSTRAKELADTMRIGVLADQQYTTNRGDGTTFDEMDELNRKKELRRKINKGVKIVVGGAILAFIAGVVYYRWPQTRSAANSISST